MPFTFQKLDIPEVILITPQVFKDDRGWFMETYKLKDFDMEACIGKEFIQDNHSFSIKNVLRGIHLQKNPKSQGKLIRCIKGKIFDVAVDLRKDSPTFKKWVGVELSEENKKMLWIPENNFGHGFLTLSDTAEIVYKCTEEYDKNCDCGIIWNDPEININWEIETPIISEKDSKLPFLKDFK